jgi:hypothetical protein
MAQRVSVVIELSAYKESPRNAIATVINNAATICDLHIVLAGHATNAELYAEWNADVDALTKLKLTPQWHNKLDATKLAGLAMVTLKPDHFVTDGSWKAFLENNLAAKRSGWARSKPTHYALNAGVDLDNDDIAPTTTRAQAMWYGFLLVVSVLDTLRSLFSWGAYHDGNAVRAQLVMRVYPGETYVPRYRWGPLTFWCGFDSGVARVFDDAGGCNRMPDTDVGVDLVLRSVRTHPHMGWGFAWITGYLLYYGLFFGACGAVYAAKGTYVYYWIAAHVFHVALVAYATHDVFLFPHKSYGIQVLLYPLYLTLSPLLFLYARLYRVKVRNGVIKKTN